MAKERGLRSSNDAKPWKCRCGKVNHPKKGRFFDLPTWECRACKREFNGTFKCCLGEVEVDGYDVIGEPLDQGKKPYCVSFAYTKAIEVAERVFCLNNGIDPNTVVLINPLQLEQRFEEKHPDFASRDTNTNDRGVYKVVHLGLILKEEGIKKVSSGDKYYLEDLSTIPRDDFSSIMECLAEGIPFLATYLAGKRRSKLKYCQIYKSPPISRYTEKGVKKKGHAVVLLGGGMEDGRKYFYCVNSWDTRFCPRKNTDGEIMRGGIGKIEACDLTKNVVKISRPEKTDPCRRLVAQDVFDISKKFFILMMALKKEAAFLLKRTEKVNLEKADDKVQCDELFEKFREDHLHGPFCDDEAGYCSKEMKDSHMDHEKIHCDKETRTDDVIHSVDCVAQTATSGAVTYFLGNQGSNISSGAVDTLKKALAANELEKYSVKLNDNTITSERTKRLPEHTPPRPHRLSLENASSGKGTIPGTGSKSPTSVMKSNRDRMATDDKECSIDGFSFTKHHRSVIQMVRQENQKIVPTEDTVAFYQLNPDDYNQYKQSGLDTLQRTPCGSRYMGAEASQTDDSSEAKLDKMNTSNVTKEGSHLRRSIQSSIGKLIHGSERRNTPHSAQATPAKITSSTNYDGSAPMATNARLMRRQSLTGLPPPSRRSSLGGKSDSSTNDKRAKPPPPMNSAAKAKRWM